MPWPTPQDYNEAIQDPQSCFSDAELKGGSPETNALGLPRPVTGNFASVYRLHCSGRDWAVRCFLKEQADQQHRYTEITNYLRSHPMSYTVPFEYIDRGILIHGRWYPILKMEWIQGQTLSEYVEDQLTNSRTLRHLADQWLTMIKALQIANVAHGDLQHGNILVSDDALKIIDYDGMYVPALNGLSSSELGHRNYQHPRRTAGDFDLYIDRFPAWVIYLSLVGLAADTSLRPGLSAKDEFILLSKEDIESPDRSLMLSRLMDHRNPQVNQLAHQFRAVLQLDIRDVPLPMAVSAIPSVQVSIPARTAPQSLPGGSATTGPQGDMSWIIDHLAPPPGTVIHSFASPPPIARVAVNLLLATMLLVVLTGALAAAGVTALNLLGLLSPLPAISLAVCVVSYNYDRQVKRKRAAAQQLRLALSESRAKDKDLGHITSRRDALRRSYEAAIEQLDAEHRMLESHESAAISKAAGEVRKKIGMVDVRKHQITSQRADRLSRAKRQYSDAVGKLLDEANRLSHQETDELDAVLRAQRQWFIRSYLERHSVADAPFPGSGRSYSHSYLVGALVRNGIRTAYDVTAGKVDAIYGFGPVRTNALVDWKDRLTNEASNLAPRVLDQSKREEISRKYESRKEEIDRRRSAELQRLTVEERDVIDWFDRESQSIATERQRLLAEEQRLKSMISSGFEPKYRAVERSKADTGRKYESDIQPLEQEEREKRKEIFSARWRASEARAELGSFQRITFLSFLKHALVP